MRISDWSSDVCSSDLERTELAVRETVEQAERVAGTNIEDVWVSFSGGSLVSDVVTVERDMGGYRVEQADIDDLLTTGQQRIAPDGRVVLPAQPPCFHITGRVDRKSVVTGKRGYGSEELGCRRIR